MGAAASQVSTKPQGECSHSPRGSGATVGYHKKGYPKQELKRLLRPYKYQSRRTTTGPQPILRFAPLRPILRFAPPRPSRRGRFSPRPPRRGNPSGRLSHPFNAPECIRYVSHDWQGTATGAMGQRSNLLFTIPTDGAGITVPCGHMLHTFPPELGTTLTTETPASYTGHLRGLSKASHSTIGYSTCQASALHRVKNPQGMACLL